MQSGITASKELVDQFHHELLASDKHFGLLATVASTSLQPAGLLTPSSPGQSFADKVTSLLSPHIKPDQALYVLLRRHAAPPFVTAVTYVPDAAPVRQKMLFASTRLTLVRALGSEHVREAMFATTPADLTPAGFQQHDAHAAVQAPLTAEETALGAVKRAEHEAGSGTACKEIHLSKTFAMPIAPDALAAMKELATESGRTLVMLKINPESEVVQLVTDSASPSPASIPELMQTISPTEPRFTLYKFTHTYQGKQSSPLLFVYTCPPTPGSKAIKNRMLYPLMKRAVLDAAEKEAGLWVDKKLEVEEPNELTTDLVLEELHPKVEVRKAFSKPKRPAR